MISDFERDAWLADEFDGMGLDSTPSLDDFDPVWVDAARRFAESRHLPLPWTIGSVDVAAALLNEPIDVDDVRHNHFDERDARSDCLACERLVDQAGGQ